MKWVGREEWRDAFADLLERHVAQACLGADVELKDLPSLLGDQEFAMVWGCAFEDFLSRDLDGGRNIVDDYLKRRGWKESPSDRAYMAALRSSVISLYEVSGIIPGESFLARDLVRGGEAVRVSERSATRSLRQWDRIAARVMEVRGRTVISGAVLGFDHRLRQPRECGVELGVGDSVHGGSGGTEDEPGLTAGGGPRRVWVSGGGRNGNS